MIRSLAVAVFGVTAFLSLEGAQVYSYHCDKGLRFVAEVNSDASWLFLPKQSVRTVKEKGVYRSERVRFVPEEMNTTIVIGDVQYHCQNSPEEAVWEAAKLQGVAFRALGNRPAWVLELLSDKELRFLTNFGRDIIRFKVIESYSEPNAAEYKLRSQHNTLFLRIEKRTCQETLTGERYESTVYLNFDGKELRGCGRALY